MAVVAAFDVDIAQEYGIPAALLLNKIFYLSRRTPREDGFCWRTSEELHDELALGEYQIRDAIKKLTDNGIIEVKNTYIQGTYKKCRHFRITNEGLEKLKSVTFYESDSGKTNESETVETNESLYIGIIDSNNRHITNDSSNTKNQALEIGFEELWSKYPSKKGKKRAREDYFKAIKSGVSHTLIANKIDEYVNYCNSVGRPFKDGSTWFHGHCWEDDYGDPSAWKPMFSKQSTGLMADFTPDYTQEGWL